MFRGTGRAATQACLNTPTPCFRTFGPRPRTWPKAGKAHSPHTPHGIGCVRSSQNPRGTPSTVGATGSAGGATEGHTAAWAPATLGACPWHSCMVPVPCFAGAALGESARHHHPHATQCQRFVPPGHSEVPTIADCKPSGSDRTHHGIPAASPCRGVRVLRDRDPLYGALCPTTLARVSYEGDPLFKGAKGTGSRGWGLAAKPDSSSWAAAPQVTQRCSAMRGPLTTGASPGSMGSAQELC